MFIIALTIIIRSVDICEKNLKNIKKKLNKLEPLDQNDLIASEKPAHCIGGKLLPQDFTLNMVIYIHVGFIVYLKST